MNDERLVNIEAFIPGIRLDIRYATANNFTKRPLYPVARCYLRKQVAEHPTKVQQELQVIISQNAPTAIIGSCPQAPSVIASCWNVL
jgi:D-alanyl-D-alanine dipeptidase